MFQIRTDLSVKKYSQFETTLKREHFLSTAHVVETHSSASTQSISVTRLKESTTICKFIVDLLCGRRTAVRLYDILY